MLGFIWDYIYEGISNKPYQLANLLISTICFSYFCVNALGFILAIVGLQRFARAILYRKEVYSLAIIFLFLIKISTSADTWYSGINVLNQLFGLYMALCASEGCYCSYLSLKSMKKKSVREIVQIFLVLASIAMLARIYYYTKLVYDTPYTKNLIPIILVCIAVELLAAGFKQKSMLYSLLIVFVCLLLFWLRYEVISWESANSGIRALCIPVEAMIIGIYAYDGQCRYVEKIKQKSKKKYGNDEPESVKNTVMASDSLFATAISFILYSTMHGIFIELPLLLFLASLYGILKGNLP